MSSNMNVTKLKIITPQNFIQGLGDTDGRDTQHIASMVRELKQLDYVNAFLVVFNSQNPRMDEHLRAMLDIFAR